MLTTPFDLFNPTTPLDHKNRLRPSPRPALFEPNPPPVDQFMKKLAFLAACGAMLAQTAVAQNATTVPVGVVTVKLDANKLTAISLPLEKAPVAFGTVTSVQPNSIADSSANFGTLGGTHFARILSGNGSGRVFKILTNSATVLTLQVGTGSWSLPVDSSSSNTVNVAAGDKFEIVPCWTLSDLFGSNSTTCVLRTASNPTTADQVSIYTEGALAGFFNNGINWRNAGNPGDTANYNTFGILPTAGLGVRRRATGTNAELQFTGNVPKTAPRFQMPGGVAFAMGMPFPAGTTLSTLGFGASPSWVRNNNPNNADQVVVYRPDNTFSGFFLNTSGVWRNAGNPGDTTNYANTEISPGSGLWIRRRGSATGATANVPSTLPYSLN